MRFRIFLTFIFLACFFIIPQLSHAQLSPQDALTQLSQNVSVTLSPTYPEPNDVVNISLESYATDLDQSQIIWSVGGKVKASGVGEKSFSLQVGGAGTSNTVDITIKPASGAMFTKTITIKPTEVDLMWQGDTYTPPFYKGLSLWSAQSSITVLAIPHIVDSNGQEMKPSSLVYEWSRNGTVLGDQSGTGKNSLTILNSIFPTPQGIKVNISSGSSILATKSIIIYPTPTNILVYEDNPLYGPLFNRGVGDLINLQQKEVTLSAYPLFFGVNDKNDGSLSYSWAINGVGLNQKTSGVTFRAPDGASGQSNLSVQVENSSKFTQTGDKSFSVQFTTNQSSSI